MLCLFVVLSNVIEFLSIKYVFLKYVPSKRLIYKVCSGGTRNIFLDSLMKETLKKTRGLHWTLTTTLTDLEYADDICLLAQSYSDTQIMMNNKQNAANQCGLNNKYIEDQFN